jgi:hypothetical protein
VALPQLAAWCCRVGVVLCLLAAFGLPATVVIAALVGEQLVGVLDGAARPRRLQAPLEGLGLAERLDRDVDPAPAGVLGLHDGARCDDCLGAVGVHAASLPPGAGGGIRWGHTSGVENHGPPGRGGRAAVQPLPLVKRRAP